MPRIHFLLLPFLAATCYSCSGRRPEAVAEDRLPEAVASGQAQTDEFGFGENDTIPVGDVNGDGKKDTAVLFNYEPRSEADSQYVTVTFGGGIPPIVHKNGFHGLMADAGDLDGNGTDEIIYVPDWYQSNSAGLFIYGYRKNGWIRFAEASIRRDIIGGAEDPVAFLKSRVKKIDNRRFRLHEHYMDENTADIADSVRIVRIPG